MLDWHLKVLQERHESERAELLAIIEPLARMAGRDDLPADVQELAQQAHNVVQQRRDQARL